MFDFDYPKVKQSLGRAALQDPYPAWFLDPCGVINAANLMAFWLWDAILLEEELEPNSLLGISLFTILADNLERIPVDQNGEFYAKISTIVKRMKANLDLPFYTPFIASMKADPRLARIYERAASSPGYEWEFPLRIATPDMRDSTELLEFQVTCYRLEGDVGFLVICNPSRSALPVFEEQYGLLTSKYGDKVYVLPDDREQDNLRGSSLPTGTADSFRTYYPTIIQDSLWYIVGENKANQLLIGGSVLGAHFFEMYLSPQLRQWMGPLQETAAPRAIRYFDVFTAPFQQEEHELHTAYVQVIKRLLQLPDFENLLDISRKLPIRLNLPENPDTSFYTCRVILPWPLSHEILLQFRSMVQFLYKGLFVHTDRRNYQVVLVPENYETEVALILLYLASSKMVPDDADYSFLKQFLWGLAVLKTVEEGLTGEDWGNMQWEPEATFGRIHELLNTKFSKPEEGATEEVIAEIRAIIEALEREGKVDRALLLSMLGSFMSTKKHLKQLSAFFAKEGDKRIYTI